MHYLVLCYTLDLKGNIRPKPSLIKFSDFIPFSYFMNWACLPISVWRCLDSARTLVFRQATYTGV